jgi:hypothetical protein
LELSSNPGCFFQIIRPYRGSKTHLSVVGSRNDIRLVGPGHERNNGAEGLFGGDFRVIGGPVDDRRVNEIARLIWILAADGNSLLFLFDIAEEGLRRRQCAVHNPYIVAPDGESRDLP